MGAIERIVVSKDWITLVLLAILFILALIKYRYPRKFLDFAMLFATNKYLLLRGKEPKISHPFNMSMFAVNVLSVSFLIFIFYQTFTEGRIARPLIIYIRIATAYAAFVLLKFGIEKIMAIILSIENTINYYLFQKLTYRNFMALILLPLNVIFIYIWEPGLTSFFIVLGLVLFINLVVQFSIYKKNQQIIFNNLFYFILYLCALEIGPYFILYKVITN